MRYFGARVFQNRQLMSFFGHSKGEVTGGAVLQFILFTNYSYDDTITVGADKVI
jgi:hypothetical protein